MTTKSLYAQSPNEKKTSMTDDIVKELALKLLEVLLFIGIHLQHPNFDATMVYHMTGKIIQRKVQLLANAAMKEEKDDI